MSEIGSKTRLDLITNLNEHDVLCGRGSGPNEREGNIKFRLLVAKRKSEYLAVNPRDYKNKNRIANEIVNIVRSNGGRFVKKMPRINGGGEAGTYELADEATVMEKAKQALRQNHVPMAIRQNGTGQQESLVTANTRTENQPQEEATEVEKAARVSQAREGILHVPHDESTCRTENQPRMEAAEADHKTSGSGAMGGASCYPPPQRQPQKEASEANQATTGPGVVGGTSCYLPLQANSHQELASNLRQENYATLSPAESAILNIQRRNHALSAQRTQPSLNAMLKSPYFSTAMGGIHPDQQRHDAVMHQYKLIQHTDKLIQDYYDTNVMSRQPDFGTASATHSDQIKFHLRQQQLGAKTAVPAGGQYPTSSEAIFSGNFSESQVKQLGNLAALSSQHVPNVHHVNGIRPQQYDTCQGSHHGSESIMDALEDISLASEQSNFVSVCSKIDQLKYYADQIKFHQEQQNQNQLNIARLCGISALPQGRQENQQSRVGTDFAGVSEPQLKALGSLLDEASKNVPNAHSSGASQPNVRSQYNCEGSPCASRSFSGVLEDMSPRLISMSKIGDFMSGQPNVANGTAVQSDHIKFLIKERLKQQLAALKRNIAAMPQGSQPVACAAEHVPDTCASKNMYDIHTVTDAGSQQGSHSGTLPSISNLEDMSLPSVSIGEISDITSLGASLSQSKRSTGGTIAEAAEMDFTISKPQEVAVAAKLHALPHEQLNSSMSRNREHIDSRHVTFLGGKHNSSETEVAATLQSMNNAKPNQQTPELNRGAKESHEIDSRQRRSLSSYYREMKAKADDMMEVDPDFH